MIQYNNIKPRFDFFSLFVLILTNFYFSIFIFRLFIDY